MLVSGPRLHYGVTNVLFQRCVQTGCVHSICDNSGNDEELGRGRILPKHEVPRTYVARKDHGLELGSLVEQAVCWSIGRCHEGEYGQTRQDSNEKVVAS